MNKYNDEQGCEIIDVIWNCKDFQKDLMDNKQTEIRKELSLKLEAISLLSKHDKIDDAGENLKKVVKEVIYIKKIRNYMSGISDYGVDWYKEYYENKEDDGKVNPIKLIADVGSNSSEIGFDCVNAKDKELGRQYFKECGKTAVGVEGRNAKVVRVLKPTAKRERSYYVPGSGGKTSGVSNKPIESSLRSRYSETISSKGKLGELVVETCDHKKTDLGFVSLEGPESIFCKEILQKFFGDIVHDKRYCLFEMPNSRNLN